MPLVAMATSGVPGCESGLASGLITTSQQMGGTLGLAIISSVASSATSALVHGFDVAMFTAVTFMVFSISLAMLVIKQKSKPSSETISNTHIL